jgi:hypothetical protein
MTAPKGQSAGIYLIGTPEGFLKLSMENCEFD